MTTKEQQADKIWAILETVTDPEIPVLSITDLGMVRKVEVDGGEVTIHITPTYSGCPATDVIQVQLRMQLLAAGYKTVNIQQVLSPAWTTNWMTPAGKEKLKAYGIAPPQPGTATTATPVLFGERAPVSCPHCHSTHTRLVSEFGSTACKALYQCEDCQEPFDYFKCH